MPTFGDNFSNEIKIKFAETNINLGSVIKIYDDVAKKEKWHLVVGISDDKIITATTRINSEINKRCIPQNLLSYQLYISKSDFDFLEHDSYVNCAEIIEQKTESFINHLANNPASLKGHIADKKFDEVRMLIATCPVINRKKKHKFNLE
jgi:hypothetical protein